MTDERRIEWRPIDELVRYPKNPKRHALGALGESVDAFGFVTELRLNETTGRLLEGQGRLDYLLAQKKAGKLPPDGIRAEGARWLAPVVRGVWLTEAQEDRFVVAANRLVEAGGWDDDALTQLLQDVSDQGGLGGTGYTEEELESLRLLAGQAPDFSDMIDRFDTGAPSENLKNKQWFCVEFYGMEPEEFQGLVRSLGSRVLRSSQHRLDPEWFVRMVKAEV